MSPRQIPGYAYGTIIATTVAAAMNNSENQSIFDALGGLLLDHSVY